MRPVTDARLEAEAFAAELPDAEYVDHVFALALRRPPDEAARERALTRLADGSLSRAALLQEVVTADEFRRVRELDDAVALGLAARARGERLQWIQAPPDTDERVVEIPWVLSRVVETGRVVEVGYAYAEPAYLAALTRTGVELVGVDLAERDVPGLEPVRADVRELPFPDASVDQVLLVSTLEHVGADNTGYGLAADDDPGGRLRALRELRRVVRPAGDILVTVPLGEPGDHGWFRQDDVRGWNRLYARAGMFVAEQEAYELGDAGWRSAPAFRADGVRYGERGPAASAVLCSVLQPGRLRRLLTPHGAERTLRRRTRPLRHRAARE
jgi:SAM-dependent methyltransferase